MTHYKYYGYDPSLASACIFTVLFGLSTLWHSFLVFKHRTWYFIPVIVGGIFEFVGYTARAISSSESPHLTLGPYVVQTLLLLVAPPLFAASIYMILGRIILSVDAEPYSLIRRKWLTKIFVISDVICFFIQLAGAGLMSSTTAATSETGSYIVLAGLLAQILIFGFFVVVAWIFHRRLLAKPTHKALDSAIPWKRFLYVLYIACAFILVRNIVRVAEFVEGFQGYIIQHEVFLYVFDAVPMTAVMAVLGVWYPANMSPQKEGIENETRHEHSHLQSLSIG